MRFQNDLIPVVQLLREKPFERHWPVLEYLGEVTVAPIASTVRDIPSAVFPSKPDGMPRDCAINCDHLQTVSKAKIGALITSLPPVKMVDVGRAIRFALDI
ncbi:MAG: type II toxin-antitoxin system PemK/MazF family toxin [Desulfosarcina sp.]|nr:type II toxin-antitoxin system PemK/MazF family toxin [Desulfosarcina sp.]